MSCVRLDIEEMMKPEENIKHSALEVGAKYSSRLLKVKSPLYRFQWTGIYSTCKTASLNVIIKFK